MAKSFKEMQIKVRRNGVTKDFMRLWFSDKYWDEGLEAHLWDECWRRQNKIQYIPDYYYDMARYDLWIDTGRVIGDSSEFHEYWKHYPDIEKGKKRNTT